MVFLLQLLPSTRQTLSVLRWVATWDDTVLCAGLWGAAEVQIHKIPYKYIGKKKFLLGVTFQIISGAVCVLLPQIRVQEIKRTLMIYLTHGLFFICTQKYHCIYKSCIAIFTKCTAIFLSDPTLCIRNKATLLTYLESQLLSRGDECPSTLDSGLPTTVRPLGFYPSQPFTPHSSNYIIYIDDINNLSRPRPGQ